MEVVKNIIYKKCAPKMILFNVKRNQEDVAIFDNSWVKVFNGQAFGFAPKGMIGRIFESAIKVWSD